MRLHLVLIFNHLSISCVRDISWEKWVRLRVFVSINVLVVVHESFQRVFCTRTLQELLKELRGY